VIGVIFYVPPWMGLELLENRSCACWGCGGAIRERRRWALPASAPRHPWGPIFLRHPCRPKGAQGGIVVTLMSVEFTPRTATVARINTVKAQYCALGKHRIENSVCPPPLGPIFLRHPYRPKGARVWWSTGAHRSRRANSVRELPACTGPCVSARPGRHSAFRGRPAVRGGAASRPKMTLSCRRGRHFCCEAQQTS
jgi:hypothetical protein